MKNEYDSSKGVGEFTVNTIEDLITAAGIVDDDQIIAVTASEVVKLRDDINKCHSLCSEMGVSVQGGGTNGLVKRLEELKFRSK